MPLVVCSHLWDAQMWILGAAIHPALCFTEGMHFIPSHRIQTWYLVPQTLLSLFGTKCSALPWVKSLNAEQLLLVKSHFVLPGGCAWRAVPLWGCLELWGRAGSSQEFVPLGELSEAEICIYNSSGLSFCIVGEVVTWTNPGRIPCDH